MNNILTPDSDTGTELPLDALVDLAAEVVTGTMYIPGENGELLPEPAAGTAVKGTKLYAGATPERALDYCACPG